MKIDEKTAFLIGSGPSLNNIDIKKLSSYNTMSLNRQYIAYDDWGFEPSFYFVCDPRLILTIIDDIKSLIITRDKIKKFFIMRRPINNQLNKELELLKSKNPEKVFIIEYSEKNTFPANCEVSADIHGVEFTMCGNAGVCAINALYLLGFEKVVLVGVDANYTPRENSIEAGVDLSHFHPNYFDVKTFKQGINQGIDNHESKLDLWKKLSDCIKNLENFEIYSATKNSPINDIFEYVEFEKLF